MKRFPIFSAIVLFVFGVCLLRPDRAQAQAMQPGVTVWIYDVSTSPPQTITGMPVLVGQPTPNDYEVLSGDTLSGVDFTGGWTSPYATGSPPLPDLTQYYYGHVWGNIVFPASGTYQFRLTNEDGAKFFLNNALVIDNDLQGVNTAVASLNVTAGSVPFYINFYNNTSSGRLLLEWMKPGDTQFTTVPAANFQTQQGQTEVTSPGRKLWTYANGSGGTAGGPGDGQPLTGVHPSFTLENIRPSGFNPQVGGMDFLSNGNLVVSTWGTANALSSHLGEVGAVYILSNLQGPGPVTISRFASGLGEPLGLKVVNNGTQDVIYVSQKREVTALIDTDGDGVADVYQTVAHDWPSAPNYHEFTFNLVYKNNYFYVTTSTPLKTGDTSYLPGTQPGYPVWDGPGSLVQIDPVQHTWKIVSNGFRTPNGMGLGVDGEIFCGDNQGDWLPSCKINHIVPGYFYGVPQNNTYPATNSQALPDGTIAPYHAPAVFMPYNRICNSDTQPVLVTTGTYAGQMLIGELTDGGINRVFMEKINGEYQGCVFAFSEGFEVGINRMAWGPDGCLYAGGLGSGGNWNWNNTTAGLQRLRPNGNITFEMKTVKSKSNGFEIEFTQPVPASVISNPANYTIQQWNYKPTISYGGNPQNVTNFTASNVVYSVDRTKAFLTIPNLKAGQWVTYFRLKNFTNDAGAAPWSTEAWYTLNAFSADTGPDFTPAPPPVAPPSAGVTVAYEAENAIYSPKTLWTVPYQAGYFDNNTSGYTGTGYLVFQNATGDSIEWDINVPDSASYTLGFRYADVTSTNLAVTVNGVSLNPALNFPPTATSTSWQIVTASCFLTKGMNAIRLTATGGGGPAVDHLELTGPGVPPPTAVVLYDGTNASVNNWIRMADGSAPNWQVAANGCLQVHHLPAPDDIVSTLRLKDFQLHIEWLSPAGGTGFGAGASGIKLQRRYGVSILNTPTSLDASGLTAYDAGGIQGLKAADSNASTGPNTWQSYDVRFAAARWSGQTKVRDARLTLYWNGTLVQNNVDLPNATDASLAESPAMDGIQLQDLIDNAGGEVQFRNIWVVASPSFTAMVNAWCIGYGLTAANTTPTANPQHDGISNLWKYAMSLDPTQFYQPNPSAPYTPQMSVATDEANNQYFQFSYRRRSDYAALGLYFTLETSTDMQTWTRQPSVEVGTPVPTGDNVTEMAVIRMTNPIPSGSQQYFARVRVEVLQ